MQKQRITMQRDEATGHEVMNAEVKTKPNAISSTAIQARKIQKKSGALNKSAVSIGKQTNHALRKQIAVHVDLASGAKTPAQRMTSDAAIYRLRNAAGDKTVSRDQATTRSSFVGVNGDSVSFGMSSATQTRLGLQSWRHK